MPQHLIDAVKPVDQQAAQAARNHWNQLTKPQGSLAHLENLAAQLAAEGVSAYPQVVTMHMLLNMRSGGAAINVLSRQVGAALLVTDVGSLSGPTGEQAELPPLAPVISPASPP